MSHRLPWSIVIGTRDKFFVWVVVYGTIGRAVASENMGLFQKSIFSVIYGQMVIN